MGPLIATAGPPRRLTYAEKGKGKVTETEEKRRGRVKASEEDTLMKIKENELTIMGRATNPEEQRMGALFSHLMRRWSPRGKAEGADLGGGSFLFRFEKKEDMERAIDNRPYTFNRWMVIIQRWEPVISPDFPSLIPFWIRIKGLPLHYWQKKLVENIGKEAGEVRETEITLAYSRVRVMVNGLAPLVRETVVEFDTGEEITVDLEYERLDRFCGICNKLTHDELKCPDKRTEAVRKERERSWEGGRGISRRMGRYEEARKEGSPRERRGEAGNKEPKDPVSRSRREVCTRREDRNQRLDHRGESFGGRARERSPSRRGEGRILESRRGRREKESLIHSKGKMHGSPRWERERGFEPKRKDGERRRQLRDTEESSHWREEQGRKNRKMDTPKEHSESTGTGWRRLSQNLFGNRERRESDRMEPRREKEIWRPRSPKNTDAHRTTQIQEDNLSSNDKESRRRILGEEREKEAWNKGWLERTPVNPEKEKQRLQEEEGGEQREVTSRLREEQSEGRAAQSIGQEIPTREEILEELMGATLMYVNHPDPKEREARRQRVIQSEEENMMEETTSQMLLSARQAVSANPKYDGNRREADRSMDIQNKRPTIMVEREEEEQVHDAGASRRVNGTGNKRHACSPLMIMGASASRRLRYQAHTPSRRRKTRQENETEEPRNEEQTEQRGERLEAERRQGEEENGNKETEQTRQGQEDFRTALETLP